MLTERLAAVVLKTAAPSADIEIPDLADARERWTEALNAPFEPPPPADPEREILLTALGLR